MASEEKTNNNNKKAQEKKKKEIPKSKLFVSFNCFRCC